MPRARKQTVRRFCVGSPGLFLVNDFTVPGATMKQGRRQEPCTTTRPSARSSPRQAMDLRFPAAVLLWSTIRKSETAKSLPRSITLLSLIFPVQVRFPASMKPYRRQELKVKSRVFAFEFSLRLWTVDGLDAATTATLSPGPINRSLELGYQE